MMSPSLISGKFSKLLFSFILNFLPTLTPSVSNANQKQSSICLIGEAVHINVNLYKLSDVS